jgi:hypothetical protein
MRATFMGSNLRGKHTSKFWPETTWRFMRDVRIILKQTLQIGFKDIRCIDLEQDSI